jgi:hypothetical protein
MTEHPPQLLDDLPNLPLLFILEQSVSIIIEA